MEIEKMVEVLDLISKDVEEDAKTLDGKPFTGKVVETQFGNHGAAIVGIVAILKELLEDKNKQNVS